MEDGLMSDLRESELKGDELREEVRQRYAEAAKAVSPEAPSEAQAGCCGGPAAAAVDAPTLNQSSCCGPEDSTTAGDETTWGSALYEGLAAEELPDEAVLASLGCGNPTAVADLHEGETVLDLGSGGGIDVLLSAKRVGEQGKVFGLDMTDEMLALANENKRKAGASNVEFLKGYIEEIPLPAGTVDVVISNCVINLSVDKPKVMQEMFRVLKPGGRLGISDVVADDTLSPEQRAERGSFYGCIAGALSFSEYRSELEAAGFTDISVTSTHGVADEMHSAIVKARKPQ
jgi:arsenite methyltransferase